MIRSTKRAPRQELYLAMFQGDPQAWRSYPHFLPRNHPPGWEEIEGTLNELRDRLDRLNAMGRCQPTREDVVAEAEVLRALRDYEYPSEWVRDLLEGATGAGAAYRRACYWLLEQLLDPGVQSRASARMLLRRVRRHPYGIR